MGVSAVLPRSILGPARRRRTTICGGISKREPRRQVSLARLVPDSALLLMTHGRSSTAVSEMERSAPRSFACTRRRSDAGPSTSTKHYLACSQSGSRCRKTRGSSSIRRQSPKSESCIVESLAPVARTLTFLSQRSPKAVPPSDEIGDLYRHFTRLNDRVSACAGAGKLANKELPTYQVRFLALYLCNPIADEHMMAVAHGAAPTCVEDPPPE